MRNRFGLTSWLGALSVLIFASLSWAQPAPAPLPSTITQRHATPRIEIISGVKRVNPPPSGEAIVKGSRAAAELVRESTTSALAATNEAFTKVAERITPQIELPRWPLVVTVPIAVQPSVQPASHSELAPSPSTSLEPPPTQIVVVREVASHTVSQTIGLYFVAASVLVMAVVLFVVRTPRTIVPSAAAPLPAVVAERAEVPVEAVMMVGGVNAGTLPEAEKFVVGPTFDEAKQQAKHAADANAQAMVQHVLHENLAMQSART
jgi:hypothetical protein